MARYDHKAVEKKWQEKWEADGIYNADDSSKKPKEYVLDMFPYPSGAGLHAGHVEGYTATDISARFARMQGKEVLHPMGWDAFGLPAENFAIKTKTPPRESTDKAINTFRRQIKSLGLSYDWSREIGTHTPEYYRWTQWFFLMLYKHGLAYRKKAKVNWCSSCQTVLANEQVVDGACERCGTEVKQKDLEQWFFKTTAYAEELLSGLDSIDWPESTKIAQRNWIGRSEGAEIEFALDGRDEKIKVFTTRPDTLFGATYLVLAPEHPLVETLASDAKNEKEVREYVKTTSNKTDMERTVEGREKTGVELKGIKAINPANNEALPIFLADYVFGSYGTGAIMAVPAHDERDFEFAEKFGLPCVNVINPYPISPVVGKVGEKFDTTKAIEDETELVLQGKRVWVGTGLLRNSGNFDGQENTSAKRAITEMVGGKMVTTYRLRDWLVSRQRYWGAPIPIIYCDKCGTVPVPEEDLPVLLPEDVDFMPTGESPLVRSKSFHDVSCPVCGKPARRESDTMDTFVCSSWYYYRFTDPHNDNAFASESSIKKWMPVNLYLGGAEHTVLHLLYARFFTKVLHA
ncbi:MAG TPA: leucine--tRNA ligase, partial [Candidatus Kaiserbacteria bacterium]|nr:leucine--tRNA ligase [Candidatus Kaiserbacteria bacterium]